MRSRIEDYGDDALIDTGDVAFSFEVVDNPRDISTGRPKQESLKWDNHSFSIGDYHVFPHGDTNDLPEEMRLILQNHYMASGQITKKTQLLWGQGPKLYREKFTEQGELVREWVDDKDVWKWINSFGGEDYLLKCAQDVNTIQGAYTKYYKSRGSRIGQNKIAKLEHISPNKGRLGCLKSAIDKTKSTHVIVTDWEFTDINSLTEFKAYPKFDHNNPFASRNSIYYSNMYSFCAEHYTVPDIYGSREWLRRSTAIPLIFKALSKNSMNIKYHIQSPADFWIQRRQELKDRCKEEKVQYNEKMFKQYKRDFLKQTAKVLAGDDNSGKFWHTESVLNVKGMNVIEQGWVIKAIDQNIKDFISGHIEISDKADRVISSAFGVHGALGNVSSDGKKDSGSEQVYAFQNYIASGVDIPEMIVCKPMNYALMANYPEKDLRIGFYRATSRPLSEQSPSTRMKPE